MKSQCTYCAQYELCIFLKGILIEELELKQKKSFTGEEWTYDTGRSIHQYFRNKDQKDATFSSNLFQ
jgi:hypothetical protein